MNRLSDLVMVALAIVIFAVAVESHAQCNCVQYAIDALQSLHIRLRTLPSIGENVPEGIPGSAHNWLGSYKNGVVIIRDINDCRTLLHEFLHHMQFLKYGAAVSVQENWQREMQADSITRLAESEIGDCHATQP